ncbi:MAG: DNA polymerase III subunit gamma/tau [Cyanobacteria bacterium]|nr:DNA polymerase III subunit gamma/tau [Cyanobacteriota bacterium]
MTQVETYIPLYRKYRPQSFADLAGQAPISQTLSNAIAMNKVAHAYLFCGPRGTGKTSTARIFAKSLNCESGPTASPCQTCASCISITQGNALDVIEFDAASNNSVNDARELIENCQFASLSGKYKIYIIDEVHMLSNSAFNALLKTLEEPPSNVIFIFATTEAHKVLPTIISRCQRFDFNRITVEDITECLVRIAQAETISIAPEALLAIARHAKGGMRDAVGLLDQVSVIARATPGHTIDREDVNRFIGALGDDVLISLVNAIADRDGTKILELLATLLNLGVEPLQCLKELSVYLRHLFLVKSCKGSPAGELERIGTVLGIPDELVPSLTLQAEKFEVEELPQALHQLATLEKQLRQSQNPQIWLEIGLLELAFRESIHATRDLIARITALEEALNNSPQASSQARPQQNYTVPSKQPQAVSRPQALPRAQEDYKQTSQAAVSNTSVASSQPPAGVPDWQEVCRLIASPPVKSLVSQHTHLLEWTSSQITLGCASEPNLKLINDPKRMLHLKKAVEQFMGHPVEIHLKLVKPGAVSVQAQVQVQAQPQVQTSIPEQVIPAEQTSLVPPVFPATPKTADSETIHKGNEPPQTVTPENLNVLEPTASNDPAPGAASFNDSDPDLEEAL